MILGCVPFAMWTRPRVPHAWAQAAPAARTPPRSRKSAGRRAPEPRCKRRLFSASCPSPTSLGALLVLCPQVHGAHCRRGMGRLQAEIVPFCLFISRWQELAGRGDWVPARAPAVRARGAAFLHTPLPPVLAWPLPAHPANLSRVPSVWKPLLTVSLLADVLCAPLASGMSCISVLAFCIHIKRSFFGGSVWAGTRSHLSFYPQCLHFLA